MEDFKRQLNFDGDTFSDLKRDMGFVLQRLLGNMQQKGASDGKMTVTIDVSFEREFIPNFDPEIEGESREIAKPRFAHKVTSSVQIKDEKKGNLDTEMELTYDESKGEYIMQPIANTQQRTIFDSDFEDNLNGEYPEEESTEEELKDDGITKALPGPVSEDDVIDAEYKEVTEGDQKENPEETQKEEGSQGEIPWEEQEDEENPDSYEDCTDEILGDDEENPEDGYDYDDPEE